MTVSALKGEFIQAAGYSRGRSGDEVELVALHTAEGSRTVQSLGQWFSSGTRKASSNAGIDDDEYAVFVTYNNTPWTNPPVNTKSDTVELCAFKDWGRAEWLRHKGMLDLAARWIAWRCAVRGLPIRLLDGPSVRAGRKGVTDHKRINDAFHKSDHTDVGPGFPWDVVIARAQQLVGVAAKPDPVARKTPNGDTWLGLTEPPMGPTQEIANVQNVLRVLGNNIVIDGIYSAKTANLINVFKEHRGINEAGVGPLTWAALRTEMRNRGL